MKATKQTFYYLITGFLGFFILVSCGEDQTPLQKLIEKRDSLSTLRAELEQKIIELDTQIEKLDTTEESTLITTYVAQKDQFKHYFEVYGNVETDKAATLYPEGSGIVNRIYVKEGEPVSKGQVILELDAELIEKNIQEVQTSLDLAKTLFEKQERLWEQNIGSEVQYLEAKNRKESLENTLATLREQRSKNAVRAPFSGVVDKIFPKVGEMAGMQMPAVRLISLENLYITADISERYINDLKEGDKVIGLVNRKDTVTGVIARIGKFINPANRTFEVRVNMQKTDAALRPNSLVGLKINDFTDTSAVIVPSSLIMQDGEGRDYVYVVEKNGTENSFIARKQRIQSGMSYEGATVVEEGLKDNDTIIDKGSRSVRDGDKVEITTI